MNLVSGTKKCLFFVRFIIIFLGANGSTISTASKDFLNEEKKNEGIDERGSLVDFYRKKSSTSNLN
jgi:hypothetical protein